MSTRTSNPLVEMSAMKNGTSAKNLFSSSSPPDPPSDEEQNQKPKFKLERAVSTLKKRKTMMQQKADLAKPKLVPVENQEVHKREVSPRLK